MALCEKPSHIPACCLCLLFLAVVYEYRAPQLVATIIINNFGLTWSYAFEAILATLVAVVLLVLLQNQPADAEPIYFKDLKSERASARPEALQQDPFLTPALRRVMLFGMVLIGAVSVVGLNYIFLFF